MKSTEKILLALALTISSTSCATAGLATDKSQGRNMNSNNEMTAADLGHRFLSLIESTQNFNDLSAKSIQSAIGTTFEGDEKSGAYSLKLPDGKWQYGITYNFDSKLEEYSNVTIELIRATNSVDESHPPCDLGIDEYNRTLKAAGFSIRPSTQNEIGGLLALHYARNDMHVQIVPQRQNPACVKAISIQKFGE
ncbi:hypothetical protein [Xanthomonas sp. 3498]|uniref:hypothetical protein n=1 Tax=Xanthomonas sp. 3498 TaxID=2663863 RepID=UPI00161DF731|nr:hypothetical protein [Xanthomonas sp. 3498]MBB5876683.1 hypothetical protein [Xanthomonas sp. 3498]